MLQSGLADGPANTIARLGGDEYLIMLTHLKDTSDAADAAGQPSGSRMP
jgi:hypothetical protein